MSVEPGTVRPGGRTARVRAAVLRAAGEVLAEGGFHGLDLADVARRAGVGKTTVYRRWGSVTGLVADVLTDLAERGVVAREETGSLSGDLRAHARQVRRGLADPGRGALLRAAVGAVGCDERAGRAWGRFAGAWVREWAPCVELAVVRGELPRGTDAGAVLRAVSDPLYAEFLTTGVAPSAAAVERAARAAYAAAVAGVYVR